MDILYRKIEEKSLIAKGNAISHVADLLAAANKIQGDNVQKFLATGDQSVLGELKLTTVKDYRDLLTMLTMLTSTQAMKVAPPNKLEVKGKVEHIHKSEGSSSSLSANDTLKELEDAELIE